MRKEKTPSAGQQHGPRVFTQGMDNGKCLACRALCDYAEPCALFLRTRDAELSFQEMDGILAVLFHAQLALRIRQTHLAARVLGYPIEAGRELFGKMGICPPKPQPRRLDQPYRCVAICRRNECFTLVTWTGKLCEPGDQSRRRVAPPSNHTSPLLWRGELCEPAF